MMRSVYSLRSLNVLAAVVVTLVCADVASAQEDGAAGLAAAGAAVELAYIGIGLTVIGSAFGIGRLAASAFEGMSRQPEMAGQLQTAMIIAAALNNLQILLAVLLCFSLAVLLAVRRVTCATILALFSLLDVFCDSVCDS